MPGDDYNLPGLGLECVIRVYLWTGGESTFLHALRSPAFLVSPSLAFLICLVDPQEPMLTMALPALQSSLITNLGPEIANDL